jgi:hypothetical protein
LKAQSLNKLEKISMSQEEDLFGKLDVGCGTKPKGDVNVDFFGKGFNPQTGDQVQGNFMAPKRIRNFVMADASHLPFKDGAFKVVLSWHTIEHVQDPFLMFKELCRVAKRKVIVRCPHREGSGGVMPYHVNFFDEAWFKKASDAIGLPNRQFITIFDYPISAKLEKTGLRFARKTLPWRAMKRFERQHLMKKIHVPWEIEAWIKKESVPAATDDAKYVVVYNRPRIFEKAFSSSKHIPKEKVTAYFNTTREPLPRFYNKTVAQHIDENVWFVFCHQDFVIEEDLKKRLKGKDTEAVYGPIGVRVGADTLTGLITQTDGTTVGHPIGEEDAPVQTLDEMCLIVHANVFREGLRFDEQFAFHFYGADFCMQAYLMGFDILAMQLKCQHKSRTIHGDLESAEYLATRELLRKKWVRFLPLRTTTTTLEPKQHS